MSQSSVIIAISIKFTQTMLLFAMAFVKKWITYMISYITDTVRLIHLPLPGHEDTDCVGGDARDAVGGHQDNVGTKNHTSTEKLQPGRNYYHLYQPWKCLEDTEE